MVETGRPTHREVGDDYTAETADCPDHQGGRVQVVPLAEVSVVSPCEEHHDAACERKRLWTNLEY